MKHVNYLSFFLLTLFSISFISCSDDDDNKLNTGITNQSWTEGKSLEISQNNELSVSFNAAAKWVASVTSGADWCKLNTTSGTKGQSTLKLSVSTSSTTDRTARISINIDGYSPASFEVTQKGTSIPQTTEDMEINAKVDEYLREMYLWNDEYKTLNLDYDKGYEDFFYDALGSMTTNTLDKRTYMGSDGKTHYTLFSYIEKKSPISSTRSYPLVNKELEYSFGITGMITIGTQSGSDVYCIRGVYPDSPASHAGIKRGTYISEIDGTKITEANYQALASNLVYPERIRSLKITEIIPQEGKPASTKEYTITSEAMYKNPVLYQDVIKTNTGDRIGYLVYAGFEAGYDDKLFEVFKEFKSQNVNELILDLRYNGGGHTISANLIASCIAGNAYKDAVFSKLRYNDERMKALGNTKFEERFSYSKYVNLNTSLAAGNLSLKRIYCLVSGTTASASELVINSLRGIDIEVVLIGSKTTGKNVGMEPAEIVIGKNTYEVTPITFQSYNAKDFGDYEQGFTPDIPFDEEDPEGDGYFNDYIDYGNLNEPLLGRAIQEITGQVPSNTRSSKASGIKGKVLKMPAIFRPGHDGMIKLPE